MSDDYWPDPNLNPNRSIKHSGETSSDGGGHRFIFYGNPPKGGSKRKKSSKNLIEAPVKLKLSDDTLAEEILEVHSEHSVKKKVEEFGDKIKEDEDNAEHKDKSEASGEDGMNREDGDNE